MFFLLSRPHHFNFYINVLKTILLNRWSWNVSWLSKAYMSSRNDRHISQLCETSMCSRYNLNFYICSVVIYLKLYFTITTSLFNRWSRKLSGLPKTYMSSWHNWYISKLRQASMSSRNVRHISQLRETSMCTRLELLSVYTGLIFSNNILII